MTVFDWPAVLRPNHSMVPVLERNNASAGVSVTGMERLLATDAGRWRYGFRVPVRNREQVLSWRALMALTEGRTFMVRVPVCDSLNDPAYAIRGAISRANPSGIPHGDGGMHDDGAGYALSLVNGTVAATANAGATSISVTMPVGLVPQPGHFFSDGDRLYTVKTATLTSGTTYALTFLPRLRVQIPVGHDVSFDRLFCIMRLASEDMLQVEQELRRFSELSLSFTEALV